LHYLKVRGDDEIIDNCDNPRIVPLTKFNRFLNGFCSGPVEEQRRRLKKRLTQGKLGVIFLDGPFFMLSFFHALFLHHPSANIAVAKRLVRSVSLTF
jgi:hypothetical protein